MTTKSENKKRKLDLTHDVLKFLQSLEPKRYKQITLSILALGQNARPHDSEVLKGYPYYRVDVGEFRIVYRFNADTVYVAHVGKRNDAEVYRWLKG
jgi:mRNA interferase RelE/StbE